MLKKAGIVVVGATAGVFALSGMAFAGEADKGSDDESSSHHHDHDDDDDRDHGHDRDRGDRCGDRVAFSGGDNVIDASNLAANSNLDVLNILSSTGGDEGCEGGDRVAFSGGDNVVDASNLLANSDVDLLNILSKTG